jgi:small subunit ribosomal protein S5
MSEEKNIDPVENSEVEVVVDVDDSKAEQLASEVAVVADIDAGAKPKFKKFAGNNNSGASNNGKRREGSGGPRRQKRTEVTESEYTEKVVQVRRVTKVVKGGKKLSFRVVVIIGNEKGKVGVGVGKASEVLNAIKKALVDARKNLVDVPMVGSTISHRVHGFAGGSEVMLKPASDGTGIIAGGTARIVLELSGLGDILSKSMGSKSPLNVARATINAIQSIRSFREVAKMRNLTVKQMLFA